MKKIAKFLIPALMATTASTAFADHTSASLKHFSKAQQVELAQFMKQFIIQHPQLILESVQRMQAEQQAMQAMKGRKAVVKYAAQLTQDKYSPTVNKGPVTLVEFFDYQCSVCAGEFPTVNTFISKHPNVRVVFKNFAIFGPASQYAAKTSIAAYMQGEKQFFAFHNAMFKSGLIEGKLKTADVNRIAKSISGLNFSELQKDIKLKSVTNELKANYKLAQALNLSGTPALIVLPTNPHSKKMKDLTFIPGAAPMGALNAAVKKLS